MKPIETILIIKIKYKDELILPSEDAHLVPYPTLPGLLEVASIRYR
jgi:hypothetical protein